MLPDLYDCTEIDDEGHARLKAEQAAAERFMKVTANCPCDQCPMARECQVECGTFKAWVQTRKC